MVIDCVQVDAGGAVTLGDVDDVDITGVEVWGREGGEMAVVVDGDTVGETEFVRG